MENQKKNVSKKSNAKIVEDLTGIKEYNANEDQIEAIIKMIHYSSIDSFKERLSKISINFYDVPSTNFLTFLERFESNNPEWIDSINRKRK